MTLDEFNVLADAWGGDVARWPEHLRPAAEALAQTPAAAAVLADAREIDRLMLEFRPDIAADRIDRAIYRVVTEIASVSRPAVRRGVFSRRWWLFPAASFACAAIVGMSLGVISPVNIFQSSADASTVLKMLLDGKSFGPDWVIR